jgi:hypothetical protein
MKNLTKHFLVDVQFIPHQLYSIYGLWPQVHKRLKLFPDFEQLAAIPPHKPWIIFKVLTFSSEPFNPMEDRHRG